MKYQAPAGVDGINLGGQHFNVGKDGTLDVPEAGNYDGVLRANGFTPIVKKDAQVSTVKAAGDQSLT